MFTRSLISHSAALAALGFVALGGSAQANTYDLNYPGNPAYCTTACLTPGGSAGTVEVTVNTTGDDFLQFHVDLLPGWKFMGNHNTTFAFSTNVTGAAISNIVFDDGGTGTAQAGNGTTTIDAGDGVGGLFSYGVLCTNWGGQVTPNDLTFDLKKAGTD